MCTVTLVPRGGGTFPEDANGPAQVLRLVCNRDEQRTRHCALPPVRRAFGSRTAVMPVDPLSGGTWIALTDTGLVVCLLNTNPGTLAPGDRARNAARSRGEIVPLLIAHGSLDAALEAHELIDARLYAPFRVLLACDADFAVLESDSTTVRVAFRGRLRDPVMLTSSGLGDHVVESPRRTLFRAIFGAADASAGAQDAFHRHAWPEHSHLSVMMSRPDARTVSQTVVEVWRDHATMTYRAFADEGPGPSVSDTLAITPIRAVA
jgi:hypothetical protein